MERTGNSERLPPIGFGVPQLDRIWSSVPTGARLLFLSDPGIEGDPFLNQAARHHLEDGRDVVVVVTDRPPAALRRSLAESGVDLDQHGERLHLVDAYSPLFGMHEPGTARLPRVDDLETWGAVLHDLADRYPGSVLLIDSFSAVADQFGIDRLLAGLPALAPGLDGYRLTAVFFTAWPYAPHLDRLLPFFDGVVGLRAVQERVVMGQSFTVDRADWAPTIDHRPRLYRPLAPDGVVVYIPKVVITGPFNAGKTTFVRSVSDVTHSVDRLGTTVALDHGSLVLDGLRVDIFGTPGQSRFDPILRVVAGQALGVVLVIDSTKPDSVARAKEMMDLTWRRGIPVIIAANKQDQPDALAPQDIAHRLAAPGWVQVVGCTATEPESARAVLRRLIDAIMQPQPGAAPSTIPVGGAP